MADHAFALGDGGPCYRVALRTRLRTPGGKVHTGWIVAAAWVPLILGAALRAIAGIRPDPIVFDISVHVRLLVALPLVIYTEQLLTTQARAVVRQLYAGDIGDKAVIDRLLARAERLRDMRWAELAIIVIAVALGQRLLWGTGGSTGVVSGIESESWSISRVWYTAVALPLLQFLMVRWLWRWFIWSDLLIRLSRHPMATIGTHPDRAAGLGLLSAPLSAYNGFVFALGAIVSGAWGTQLIRGEATIPALIPTLALFVVAAIVIGCGPLVAFSGHLFRARRFTLAEYNPLAREYMTSFHAKWVLGPRRDDRLLGTSDIQSLADMGNAYSVIVQSHLFVFSMPALRNLAFAAVLPMLPLLATVVPMEKLIRRLAGALFGISL